LRLAQRVGGISKLVWIILVLIFFVLGATFSYIFTMGFYAPSEFNNPRQPSVAVEDVSFFAQNATFFNVTLLNPSYSPSNVTIDKIKVETPDGKLHDTITPLLPVTLERGNSETLQSFWNWGNYTGQTVTVHAAVKTGLGSNLQAITPSMNLQVVSVDLDLSESIKRFNITVQNAGSSTPVDITQILVNGIKVNETDVALPYALSNASDSLPKTFQLGFNWIDLQSESVAVTVQTYQGYAVYKTVTAPGKVLLQILDVNFDETVGFDRFNLTVLNAPTSSATLNISEVELFAEGDVIRIQNWTTSTGTPRLVPNFPVVIVCPVNWFSYRGKAVTITVVTVQGFQISSELINIP